MTKVFTKGVLQKKAFGGKREGRKERRNLSELTIMKKLSVSLIALAAVIAAPSIACAAPAAPGWYAAAGAGLSLPNDPDMYAGGAKLSVENENTALGLSAGVGYAFGNGLRLGAEYFHNRVDAKTVNAVAGSGHLTNNALMFNAYYDIDTGSVLTPYVGAGIGPDFIGIDNVGAAGAYLDGDTVRAAYQAIAGVSARVDENWAVTADYRYMASFDPKVDYTGGTKGRIENSSHNIMIGLRYSFGEEKAVRSIEKPQVAKHKPAKAAVAPVGQNYMVFFDFDKSVLTEEAKGIIASAVKKFDEDGFAKIVVTGHTDTVGTKEYNQALSERRAGAVKVELEALGVKAANVKERGVGKKDLLVPTTDGVREVQNRRAEIVLTK